MRKIQVESSGLLGGHVVSWIHRVGNDIRNVLKVTTEMRRGAPILLEFSLSAFSVCGKAPILTCRDNDSLNVLCAKGKTPTTRCTDDHVTRSLSSHASTQKLHMAVLLPRFHGCDHWYGGHYREMKIHLWKVLILENPPSHQFSLIFNYFGRFSVLDFMPHVNSVST
jgi:hypothetical protein